MDKDRFWEIVSASRVKSGGQMERQLEALQQTLTNLSPEEIIDYQKHFYECMDRSYTWDLWGAAFIIQGGCSDDDFMDFRSWLISMGKDIYEATLKDVESLIDVVDRPDVEDCFFEEFLYVPSMVYEDKTGEEMPHITRDISSEPQGKPWDEEDLQKRFPKLWEEFGYVEE